VVGLATADLRAAGYAIRRATLFDLRAVHRLELAVFPRDAYPYFDLALLFVWPGIVNLKAVAPDGSLAGFASGTRARMRRHGWIITLGVDPAHQRRGVGRWLLAASEERLNKPCTRLTVRAGNIAAITLYRHSGYAVIEHKPYYYHDGETGLVMEKCTLSEAP
jgi:ribosomal-protein-alanine N-acetyltransferase